MTEFQMGKSFHIDSGELDGLTLQESFVLGYELAEIDAMLKLRPGFQKPVHAKNQARIRESCEQADRLYELDWMVDDVSESWMYLYVHGER